MKEDLMAKHEKPTGWQAPQVWADPFPGPVEGHDAPQVWADPFVTVSVPDPVDDDPPRTMSPAVDVDAEDQSAAKAKPHR